MNASELKYRVEQSGNDPYFFSHKTMKFFGDTMRNYGVRQAVISTYTDANPVTVWELYRRHAVKHGLKTSAYFRTDTFQIVHPKKGE